MNGEFLLPSRDQCGNATYLFLNENLLNEYFQYKKDHFVLYLQLAPSSGINFFSVDKLIPRQ